jgi:hypothetical protein
MTALKAHHLAADLALRAAALVVDLLQTFDIKTHAAVISDEMAYFVLLAKGLSRR